ncbi:MAG: M55 family metallopeptidase [Lentisphaeria bacterium]
MKIYLTTDIEGVAGVLGRANGVGNSIGNVDIARDLLLKEINAAVEGLVKGGADDILVLDRHGGGNNIDIRWLHPAARFSGVSGFRATLLSSSFDAMIRIGCHAMQGNELGHLNHTMSSGGIANIWLNDSLIGETGMLVLQASYFRVPTILISGDQEACREGLDFIGNEIETVVTKESLERYSAIDRNPVKVREELTSKAEKAVRNIHKYPIKHIPGPYELKVQYMGPNSALRMEMIGAERLNADTVVFRSDDYIDCYAQFMGWAPGVHNRKYGISPAI